MDGRTLVDIERFMWHLYVPARHAHSDGYGIAVVPVLQASEHRFKTPTNVWCTVAYDLLSKRYCIVMDKI